MNRSIEGGSGFAESLLVGSCRDEGVGVTGFEGSGKPSFDVLMISFRFQQRERLPAA